MSEPKELIIQPKKELLDLFEVKNGMKPVLERLKEIATSFEPDITTKAGRELIASQAYAVAKSKTYLDGLGKELTQEWRDKTANVNGSRNDIKSFCDDLRDEIRKPLTEYEEIEKKKIAELKIKLATITDLKITLNNRDELSTLRRECEKLEQMDVENDGWGEMEFQAFKGREQSLKHLKTCISEREAYDKDQIELKRLRVIEEKREKEEADRIKKENEAKRVADEKREKQEEIDAAKKEASEKAEREKREALEKKDVEQKAEIERIENEKNESQEREAQAKKDKEDADRRAEESEAKLKKIHEESKARIDKAKAQKDKALSDERENKRTIHNIILKSLLRHGIEEDIGKGIITLIGKKLIPNIKIDYSLTREQQTTTESSEILKKKDKNTKPTFRLD